MTARILAVIEDTLLLGTVTPDDTLADICHDDLDRIAIAQALDEEFGMALPDAVVLSWQSVADVIASVAALAGEEA